MKGNSYILLFFYSFFSFIIKWLKSKLEYKCGINNVENKEINNVYSDSSVYTGVSDIYRKE